MIIACPQCRARYRIKPPADDKPLVRVKCPSCQHTFELSVEADAVSAASAPSAAPTEIPGQREETRPLVLVVDDARFFREMIRDLLADLPVSLETAGDGREALEKIRALHPSLLLVDLNIPGMSGQELIEVVRHEPGGREIRILAMSGVQRGDEAAHAVRSIGADDFINKSFRPRDLQERVRQLLKL
ncbi:MAG: response regulator [Deltaproteobacteria bacterium]|nr:MAG: response regulator [Deltaproteobacteria bacterium]